MFCAVGKPRDWTCLLRRHRACRVYAWHLVGDYGDASTVARWQRLRKLSKCPSGIDAEKTKRYTWRILTWQSSIGLAGAFSMVRASIPKLLGLLFLCISVISACVVKQVLSPDVSPSAISNVLFLEFGVWSPERILAVASLACSCSVTLPTVMWS